MRPLNLKCVARQAAWDVIQMVGFSLVLFGSASLAAGLGWIVGRGSPLGLDYRAALVGALCLWLVLLAYGVLFGFELKVKRSVPWPGRPVPKRDPPAFGGGRQ